MKYIAQTRNELIRVVSQASQKKKISLEINTSIEREEQERKRKNIMTKEVEPGLRKRRRKHRKGKGGSRIVMRATGQVWVVTQQPLEEITWRKEMRRRELLERWEAPPLGPPKEG